LTPIWRLCGIAILPLHAVINELTQPKGNSRTAKLNIAFLPPTDEIAVLGERHLHERQAITGYVENELLVKSR
jgi:hypothetical protein